MRTLKKSNVRCLFQGYEKVSTSNLSHNSVFLALSTFSFAHSNTSSETGESSFSELGR